MSPPTKVVSRRLPQTLALARQAPVQLTLNIERVAMQLSQCVSVDEVSSIMDTAAAVLVYQRRRKAGETMAQDAGEILTRAEARLGELLAKQPSERGGRGKKTRNTSDGFIPVSRTHAKRAKELAAIPAEKRDAAIADARKAGKVPTPGGVRAALKPKTVDTIAEPVGEQSRWQRNPKTVAKYERLVADLAKTALELGLEADEVSRAIHSACMAARTS
jgi:hypothetical protein